MLSRCVYGKLELAGEQMPHTRSTQCLGVSLACAWEASQQKGYDIETQPKRTGAEQDGALTCCWTGLCYSV